MIEENVKRLLEETKKNALGEDVTLVAATKTRSPEEINRAILAGIGDIGENKVQEFCEKYDAVQGANRHFIGHLQTNKVKYLIGRTYLYHSVDRNELAQELDRRSVKAGIVSDVLIQINIGEEAQKGGYPLKLGEEVFSRLSQCEGLNVRGFMAMLPVSEDEEYLARLCDDMRALFDVVRRQNENVQYLSMGMSGDWRLCLAHGANMIRIGSAIFGERNYR